MHVRGTAITALIVLATAGCGSGGSTSQQPKPSAAAAKGRIVSSISPGSKLSTPVQWRATVVGVGPADVVSVDFLIDGKVVHTESKAPYDLNEDGNGLVPSLLPKGKHSLAVRADSAVGKPLSTASDVTVAAREPLPDELLGDWKRKVTKADIARTERTRTDPQLPPPGTWKLHVKPNGFIGIDDPGGSGTGEATTLSGTSTLTLYGPPNWMLPDDRQGSFCGHEPIAPYRFTVRGGKLVLHGREQKCADRDSILTGTWARD